MHSRDLLSAFERVIADPEPGAVYNIGGGRDANCSVLEAMDLAQEIAGRRLQWSYVDPPRRGDHQWWISDLTAFRSRYPGWRVTYGIEDILREIYEENLTRWDGAQRGRAVPVRSRVAVIKLGSLGDVVRTTCLLPGIRRSTTGLEITWVTRADALPLLHGHPDVDRPVTIEDERREWRRNRYDWVISLDDDPEACRLASALSAKRLSGGYEDAHGHLTYTPDMAGWFGMGILRPESEGGLTEANRLKRENVLTYGTILYRSLGLPGPVSRPSFTIPPAALEQGRRCLARIGVGSRRVVGLSTGAGTRWEFKSWGELQTATLAHAIATEIEADVVILGGPAETERNRRIVALARHDRVVGAPTDLDVPTFAAVLASCDVLVSSDSLAVHLACGVQVPVVALFGPTSALEIDLYDTGEKIVTPLACRCCYLRTCDVRPHCMDSISVQRVLEAVARQLRHVTAGAPLAACQ
jgi:heptosyltransferase-2